MASRYPGNFGADIQGRSKSIDQEFGDLFQKPFRGSDDFGELLRQPFRPSGPGGDLGGILHRPLHLPGRPGSVPPQGVGSKQLSGPGFPDLGSVALNYSPAGGIRAGASRLAELLISQWAQQSPDRVVIGDPGAWGTTTCGGAPNMDYDWLGDSSIYCGPLEEGAINPTGAARVIFYQNFGAYERWRWQFETGTSNWPDPYPYRFDARWDSGFMDHWFDDGGKNWFKSFDYGAGLQPEPQLPETVPGSAPKWTFLWNNWKVPTTWGRPRDSPEPYPPPDTQTGREPPTPRNPQPPGPKVKERKGKLSCPPESIICELFSQLTEIGDIIDCAWEAIPKNRRTKPRWDPTKRPTNVRRNNAGKNGSKLGGWRYPSLVDKGRDVYDAAFELDLGKFISCLAANHIEDALIGKLGQLTANANQVRGTFAGLGFGPAL